MDIASLDLLPFWVSFKLATWTTFIVLVLAFPLAWIFMYSRRRWMPFVEALFSLGLVLPPTVLGFYLLLVLSPYAPLGNFIESVFGVRLVFSFPGLVVASSISGLPFMMTALKSGLHGIPKRLLEASWTMGKGTLETALRVVVPTMGTSILAGVVATFAHTLGEFGIVLMIGGSLPGVTKVVSIAIFEEVEAGRLNNAHAYALVLVVLSYLGVLFLNHVQKQSREQHL